MVYLCLVFFQLAFIIHLEATLTWSPAVDISSPGQNALAPQACFTPEGYANVIWSRSNGSNFVIQTSTASPNGNWSYPFRLSKNNQNAFFPVIVTDLKGNTTALWSRMNGTNFVIQSDDKNSHQNWSDPVAISGSGPLRGDASIPQIALDPKGLHMAVWQKNNGINNVIQVAQKRQDGNWDKPVNLTKANPAGLGDINPQISLDRFGNAYAIWVNDSTTTLRGAGKSKNGNWGSPVDISSSFQRISDPGITSDGQGNIAVVWSQNDGTNDIVQTASKSIQGVFSPAISLSIPGQDAIRPQIASDQNGNKAIVWQRFDGTNTIVQIAVQPVGYQWSSPMDLSIPGQDASDPQISIDAFGNIIVIWKRSDGSHFIIESTVGNVTGSSWSNPVPLSAPGQDAMTPYLAVSLTGNVLAVWQRSDGANSIIQGAFGIKK